MEEVGFELVSIGGDASLLELLLEQLITLLSFCGVRVAMVKLV